MTNIVGVRLKRVGSIYNFDPIDLDLQPGEIVVASTTRGPALGWVVIPTHEAAANEKDEALKPILRRAEPSDLEQERQNQEKALKALVKAKEISQRLGLHMKMLEGEYSLDSSRLTIYFSAEGRVDFRDLARELGSTLKARVELHQVGTRDATRHCAGLGLCGRPLCCTSHLCSFQSISMKMAKIQDLPLNPTKISGLCGRLLCCLAYEAEQYREIKEKLPRVGQAVLVPQGPAKVVGVNPLKETIFVQLESETVVEVAATEAKPTTAGTGKGQEA